MFFKAIKYLFAVSFLIGMTYSQAERPLLSQYAEVKQRVGLTDITITFHRPGVKGRVIWGKLVPYGEIWRAGANNATTIEFSDDVKLNGKYLDAGKYSFFILPEKDSFTVMINTEWDQWGAFFVDTSKNVLSFKVKPEKTEFTEWLDYCFSDLSIYSAVISLHWENLSIPFKVEVFTDEAMKKRNEELQHNAMLQYFNMAATYQEQGTHWKEAMEAIQKSIDIQENFDNVKTKSELLAAKGNWREAVEAGERAILISGKLQPKWYVEKFTEEILFWKKNIK